MAIIRNRLKNLTNKDLIDIIEKLYTSNKVNKIYLDTLFFDENRINKYKHRLLNEIEKTFWIKGNLKSPKLEKLEQIFEQLDSVNHDRVRFECCLVFADELSHYISNIYQVKEGYITLLFNTLSQCVNIVERDENLVNKYVSRILSYDLDSAFVDIGEINNFCYILTNKIGEDE